LDTSVPGYASLIPAGNVGEGKGGICQDTVSRSISIVGDINGDGFEDLVVGYPLISSCSIFFGSADSGDSTEALLKSRESFKIMDSNGENAGSALGWAIVKLSDVNRDTVGEVVISAIGENTVYIIFGSSVVKNEIPHMFINELTANQGFRVIGRSDETHFGVALAAIHDFNRDGYRDLAISSLNAVSTATQNVLYILFLRPALTNPVRDILFITLVEGLDYLKIVAPAATFAGFSVAAVGDINQDGFADFAIGSSPRGSSGRQTTYLIYDRIRERKTLHLTSFTTEDGVIVQGAGFLVAGAGDVNGDGVADLLVSC
jgi:hypothetical protein